MIVRVHVACYHACERREPTLRLSHKELTLHTDGILVDETTVNGDEMRITLTASQCTLDGLGGHRTVHVFPRSRRGVAARSWNLRRS